MDLVKKLINYIENNNIDYNYIASELELEEQELKRMLFWDEDLLISELDDILEVIGITIAELLNVEVQEKPVLRIDSSINLLMDSLSNEEKELLEHIINMIESDPMAYSQSQGKKSYIN